MKSDLLKTLSFSQLNTFKICPEQYKIIYIDGIRKISESIEAFMGKRVHEVLEWLYSDENSKKSFITFDSLCKKYDNNWILSWHDSIYIADRRKTTDYYYSIGKRCLSNYYTLYGPMFDQRVKETELELQFKIGKYFFKGVIDRLDHIKPDRWIIHDYKTTGRLKSQKQAENDIQLALYQLAVQQNYMNTGNIFLTWHFLRMGLEVTVSYSKEQLNKNKLRIINMADKLFYCLERENKFFPKESFFCNWCYLWDECSAKVDKNQSKIAD